MLIERVPSQQELRFWVTACSTGEEAYSLAILIDEILEESQQQIPVKIFATDIDRSALEKASQGIYPTSIANGIEPERLQKYFVAKDNSYQVVRKIRKKIIFSVHDLTNDAGFTRMHFISCRNVLIYLQPKLQNLVLRNLHFSLVARGILFLGEAETVETFAKEFKPLDRQWKIYQKRGDVKMPLGFQAKHRSAGATTRSCSIQPQAKLYFESILEQSLDQLLAESQSMLLIVARNRRLVHVCGNNAAKIFKTPDGKITTEVSQMVVSPLQLPLDTALRRAKAEQKPIAYTGIKLGQGDNTPSISLTVIPPNEPVAENYQPLLYSSKQQAEQFWLVRIREEILLSTEIVPEQFEVNHEAQRRNLELEQQLQLTRANLESLVEELDTANKEQQASNEELAAANEELQSTNEELHTLNSEYQAKIQELTELNNDIDNLLNSTDIGVIFLDRKLKIRKFTPAATLAIALRNTDIGRPISELAFEIECPDLQSLLLQVLNNQKTVEREVKLNNSNLYLLMRLNPYLSENGRRNGVVISFVKLNEIKRLQRKLETTLEALRQSEARLNLAISAADIGTWISKPQDNSFIWDNNVHHLYGLTAKQMPRSLTDWLELVHPNDRPIVEEQIEAAFAAQKSCRVDYRIILPNRREHGQTGLIKAASFQPDAILLDLVMPVMDGKTMTAEIRRNSSLQNIKIFIISANIQSLRDRQEIDCNGFLPKPVDFKQLLQLLETELSLEWKTHKNAHTDTDEDLSKIELPSERELVRLLELAKLGDLEALERQLESLTALDSKYIFFTQQAGQLAAGFQQHELINFIEQFL